jgi:hypothetical protein
VSILLEQHKAYFEPEGRTRIRSCRMHLFGNYTFFRKEDNP